MNQSKNYDSTFCGNIPIHLINLIQPYGALIVADLDSLTVLQTSENINVIFNTEAPSFVNSKLTEHLDTSAIGELQEKLSDKSNTQFALTWNVAENKYSVLVHRKETYLLAEIDATPVDDSESNDFVSVYGQVKHAVAAINKSETMEQLYEASADVIKKISGFDKIMIYEFDKEWNGTVKAEAREDFMEPYLGFTFPASDIPRQARDLYLKNPYRFIPDKDYKPVKLFPVISPATNSFLDLSDCNVRGVVAVHLQYLSNMGVTASMSVRILFNEELWGLIACHHKTAKQINYQLCAVLELLSNTISARITALLTKQKHSFDRSLQTIYTDLVEELFRSGNLQESLLEKEKDILQLFNAGGAVIKYQNNMSNKGNVPPKSFIDDMLLWLNTKQLRRVYQTNQLPEEHDLSREYKDVASGMMVIPLNSNRDEYIMLFRPETVQVINWGGNPEERITFEKDMKTYHPRHSFKLWQENVDGVSLPWKEEEIQTAEALRSFIYEYATTHHA